MGTDVDAQAQAEPEAPFLAAIAKRQRQAEEDFDALWERVKFNLQGDAAEEFWQQWMLPLKRRVRQTEDNFFVLAAKGLLQKEPHQWVAWTAQVCHVASLLRDAREFYIQDGMQDVCQSFLGEAASRCMNLY